MSKTIDSILQSSLTVLLALVAGGIGLWFWVRHKPKGIVILIGYGIAALWLIYVNATNNKADAVFSGNADQFNELLAGPTGAYGTGAQSVGNLVGSL